MALRINAQGNFGKLKLSLVGRLDETFKMAEYDYNELEEIEVDFSRVSMITSSGVRSWVEWISLVKKANGKVKVNLVKCPDFIADQASKIMGFLPEGVRINSFDVIYHCDTCDKADTASYNVGADRVCEVKACLQPKSCAESNCPKKLEMDVIPKKFFRFLEIQGDKLKLVD